MNKQKTEEYLSEHAFFKGLGDVFIKFLAEAASETEVKAGEVLFKQGSTADKFYLLRDGQVAIQVPALMGPALEIQSLGKDKVLGWSWMIAPYRWHFLARAIEDSTIIEFDGSAILERCEQDPRFGYELLKRFAALMSERLDAARQKMMDEWNPPGFA